MSLTSYRAAPPRAGGWWLVDRGLVMGRHRCRFVEEAGLTAVTVRSRPSMVWKTWRRPTLPRLEPQYHGRWGFSRPSSGRDRVRAPRQSHQVVRAMRQSPVFRRQLSGNRMTVLVRASRAVCACRRWSLGAGPTSVVSASANGRLTTDTCFPGR